MKKYGLNKKGLLSASLLRSACLLAFLSLASGAFAQKNERDYLRSGNRLYRDSLFVKAEVDYRKALDLNPKSSVAMYNLGNALLMQQKGDEAMKQYEAAASVETDKQRLAQIYHNEGVLLQAAKQYPACIEAYKKSLRNNPADDETRYNLALAQKLLKDQQNQQNQNQDQQDQQKQDQQDQKDQDKQKEQQNQDKKDQNQNQNQQPQQQKDELSKENANQMLRAAMRDEKEVQDKVKKQLQVSGKKLDKDW
jgi:tetratricopeptide (TPR) repeat protein